MNQELPDVQLQLLVSHVCLFATPWTVAHQGPLSMEFPRQEYWRRLPFPSPGHLPNLGTEATSLASPALAGNVPLRKPPLFFLPVQRVRTLVTIEIKDTGFQKAF